MLKKTFHSLMIIQIHSFVFNFIIQVFESPFYLKLCHVFSGNLLFIASPNHDFTCNASVKSRGRTFPYPGATPKLLACM